MSAADRHQQAPTPVRLPDDLKEVLRIEARANNRSLNSEVITRLRGSFQPEGMTLRDYFAAHAPAIHTEFVAPEGTSLTEAEALWRFEYADAMLKARAA